MKRNIIGGLFLILIGCVFIMNNFGLIGWDFWRMFWDFWPLLLVALGVHLLFRSNTVIQIIIFILILIIPFIYYFSSYNTDNNDFPRRGPFRGNYETLNEKYEDTVIACKLTH